MPIIIDGKECLSMPDRVRDNKKRIDELEERIDTINNIKVEIVESLPSPSAEYEFNITHTIYMVKQTDNSYNEYICILEEETYKWELVGTTQVDLSNYYTKAQTESKIAESVPDGTGHLNKFLRHGTTGNSWEKVNAAGIDSGVAPLGYYLRSTGSGSAEFISPYYIAAGTSANGKWTSITLNGITNNIPQGGGGTQLYAHVSTPDGMGCQIIAYSVNPTPYTSNNDMMSDINNGYCIAAWYNCYNDTGSIGNINYMYGSLYYSAGSSQSQIYTDYFAGGDTVTAL